MSAFKDRIRELALKPPEQPKPAIDKSDDGIKAARWQGTSIAQIAEVWERPYDEIKAIVLSLSEGAGVDHEDGFRYCVIDGECKYIPNTLTEEEREVERLEYIKYQREQQEDMDAIYDAVKSELPVEVIYWAMKELRENPTKPISECIGYGFCEWIK